MNVTGHPFKAYLFHPDFGNEVVEGDLYLERQKARFVSADLTDEIPADVLVLRLGADRERVYFDDPSRPELQLYTLDFSVLDDNSLPQMRRFRTDVTADATRREIRRRLRILGYFALACVLFTMAASWAIGAMVRSVAHRVPRQWEDGLGRSVIDKLQAADRFVDDPKVIAELTKLAAPLIQELPPEDRNLKFYILKDEDPNAFALPGGYVVVNEGLLDFVDRPEDILGVLAHEMAHVTQKHHVRKVISAAGPLVVFGVFLHSRSGAVNVLALGSGLMVFQGFSQEFESEADRVGWSYLVAANIDPRGMIDTFKKLELMSAATGREAVALPRAFSSHPALPKRIARLEALWAKMPRQSGFLQLTNPVPRINGGPTLRSEPAGN